MPGFRRVLHGRRGAILGEEKWVTEEELLGLISSSQSTGMFLEGAPQLRYMLLRHRLWEATVRAAVVGALTPVILNPKPNPAKP